MALFLLRQNPVQQAAAELFGCSQSTVSRRLALLGPLLEQVLAEFVPDPAEASTGKVVLVDGTLVTTWDWAGRGTELFSGKHCDTGFNLQIAATLDGGLLAVSAPVPGSWHDIRAWRESGFPGLFADRETMGDLGYIGTRVHQHPARRRRTSDRTPEGLEDPRHPLPRPTRHPPEHRPHHHRTRVLPNLLVRLMNNPRARSIAPHPTRL
ncbi:transposase [Streptomyces sp. NBC_00289]|uniref:transposase family protein n=1 Tax=Streptomyces sp. NBC_00289 TaxID=2975703 RepID=UPI0032545245